MKAIIMGGGMSGLATAVNLADLGIEVELVESDNIFGGRASSWLDEDGDMIDNALHVFFPYYVNLVEFFKKMGIYDNIIWKPTEFYYMQENGKEAVMKYKKLPAPFHAVYAFLNLLKGYEALPKWKLIFSMIGMGSAIMLSEEKLNKLDDVTLGMWLSRKAPFDAAKMMEPGVNGLTFTPSYLVSAKIMLNWLKKVGADPESARVGFANGGLGEIWVDTCLDYIKAKGGTVELEKAVTAIAFKDNKIDHIEINGNEKRKADIYISAISPYSLRSVIPEEAFKYEYFQDLTYFHEAPSMSIQIWYDKKLTDIDVTFFSNDCIFNTYADLSNVLPHIFKGGTMFEMVISPADSVQLLPDEVIFEKCASQIRKLFPTSRDATVLKWKVVRERQGVYRPMPGMEKHRPLQKSPIQDFYITGDFTKTHVSSGGMEAAIWNSNRTAEIIAEDKLGKSISLNKEWNPNMGLVPYLKPLTNAAVIAFSCIVALKALKVFFGLRRR